MDGDAFSDQQSAGQRLMVGFEGTGLNEDLKFLIGNCKVGGIILFAINLVTPEQIRTLCADAQGFARSCGQPPLLIAIDQEGGSVARLKEPFTQFAGNCAMTGEADARRFARVTAADLHSVGINMNMAPVMDVDDQKIDGVMSKRAFGSDPVWVSHLGCAVIETLQQERIMAVAKHFPGIGRTTLDSHLAQPILHTDGVEMAAVDFPPFEAAIAHHVSGIMLSHILYSDLDGKWPASLSVRIARGLLRDRMGYEGVVMTDDLDMGSIRGRYDIKTAMERVVAADIDMALICHKGPDIESGFHELVRGIGESPETRLKGRASVRRIMALKRKFLF